MRIRFVSCRKTGPKKDAIRSYVEVDFVENTTKKAMAIRKSKELSAVLGPPEDIVLGTSSSFPISSYREMVADLRT